MEADERRLAVELFKSWLWRRFDVDVRRSRVSEAVGRRFSLRGCSSWGLEGGGERERRLGRSDPDDPLLVGRAFRDCNEGVGGDGGGVLRDADREREGLRARAGDDSRGVMFSIEASRIREEGFFCLCVASWLNCSAGDSDLSLEALQREQTMSTSDIKC